MARRAGGEPCVSANMVGRANACDYFRRDRQWRISIASSAWA